MRAIAPRARTGFLAVTVFASLCCLTPEVLAHTSTLNLRDFGAVGDGDTDDGPALQAALDALGAAGGGTLFVPSGRYVIASAVSCDFNGLASSIVITGVESSTPVDTSVNGSQLATDLNLVSEFYPRTGSAKVAISIMRLTKLLISDVAFVGDQAQTTDALITLNVGDVEEATIRHCEFYGLSSMSGAIVSASRSRLQIEHTKFLGSTGNSGTYSPVVQNVEWKGIGVVNCIFLDYGNRPEFFGKLGLGSPISWVNIGNAAVTTNDSLRREVEITDVFLDEGGFFGISSLPGLFQPLSAPIDLVYVSGVRMNVTNLGASGNYLSSVRGALIENSKYGWSHNVTSAVSLIGVNDAILDQLECTAAADHIFADSATGKLTVINSLYSVLDSNAQVTNVVNTQTPEEDAVQFVRHRFEAVLGRPPDPAAHFYWSKLLLECGQDANCVAQQEDLFNSYIERSPAANFAIRGQVTADGSPLSGVLVRLSGSQTAITQTDTNGNFSFSKLPSSGVYTLDVSKTHYTFIEPTVSISYPSSDQTVNLVGSLDLFSIRGHVRNAAGQPVTNATITLQGSAQATVTTDANGSYSFDNMPAGGNYTLTPSKPDFVLNPSNQSLLNLNEDQTVDFTLISYNIAGRVTRADGLGLAGAVVTLAGSASDSQTTGPGGNYSFSDVPAAGSYTITVSLINYSFTPAAVMLIELGADQVRNFSGQLNFGVPVLLTQANSSRAIAVDSVLHTDEPFQLNYSYSWGMDTRTRITLFAENLELAPGEGMEAFTADAEDASGRHYILRVEYVGPDDDIPSLHAVVLRLADDMADVGDVLIRISYRGLAGNRVRVGIGHIGGGPPNDECAFSIIPNNTNASRDH